MLWHGVYHRAKIHGFSKRRFVGLWVVVVAAESCCCLRCYYRMLVWTVLQSERCLFVDFVYGVAGLSLLLFSGVEMRNEKALQNNPCSLHVLD